MKKAAYCAGWGVGTKSGILCIVFRGLGFSYTIGVPYYIVLGIAYHRT